MGHILYIDATVRRDSRTAVLARFLLSRLEGNIETVRLIDWDFPAVNESYLTKRSADSAAGTLGNYPLAKQFAAADTVVIAAPYWDLSFPARLKQYFELINVIGVTFAYNAEGKAYSLCRAKKLYYLTTAGGKILSDAYGFGYVQALSDYFYKIPECVQFKAECLDLPGTDIQSTLNAIKAEIERAVP